MFIFQEMKNIHFLGKPYTLRTKQYWLIVTLYIVNDFHGRGEVVELVALAQGSPQSNVVGPMLRSCIVALQSTQVHLYYYIYNIQYIILFSSATP